MKRFTLIILALLILCSLAGGQTLREFVKPLPLHPDNRILLGDYYAVHGDITPTYKADLAEIKVAKMDGILYSWWNRDDESDSILKNLLIPELQAQGLKFAILFETLGSYGQGNYRPEELCSMLAYIWRIYGHNPAFLRLNNKPVVYIYASHIRPVTDWSNIIAKLKTRGMEFHFIADMFRADYLSVFDGIGAYVPCDLDATSPGLMATYKTAEGNVRYPIASHPDPLVYKSLMVPIAWKFDDTALKRPKATAWGGDRDLIALRRTLYAAAACRPDVITVCSLNEKAEKSSVLPRLAGRSDVMAEIGKFARAWKSREF